jgi:hypothetical protein
VTGHVFLSYSRDDASDYVKRLVEFLRAEGIPTWFDRDLEPGEQWVTMLQERIDSCAAFVPVMTAAGERSGWIQNEIAYADRKSKRIMPLLLAGDVYFALGNRQYEDVTSGNMPQSAFIGRLRELTGTGPLASNDGPVSSNTTGRPVPVAGSADFREFAAKHGAPNELQLLTRLADWADELADKQLAVVKSLLGKSPRAMLLPLLADEGVGIITIYCERGRPSIQFWRSVFERRASGSIPAVEAAAGKALGAGNSTNIITETLLDALAEAYREAAR